MVDWIFLGENGTCSNSNVFWYNVETNRFLIASCNDSHDQLFNELYGRTPPISIDFADYITEDLQVPISSIPDTLCEYRIEMVNFNGDYDLAIQVYPDEYEVDKSYAQDLDWTIIGSVDGIVYFDDSGRYIAHNMPIAYGYSYSNPKPSTDCRVYELSGSLNSGDTRALVEFVAILKALGVRMGDY